MKKVLSIIALLVSSVVAAHAQGTGGGGSGLPNPGSAGLCLVSTGASTYGWGSCAGTSSSNFSTLVADAPNISTGTFQVGNGTTWTFTGTGVVNANKVNSVAYPSTASTGNVVPVLTSTNTITYEQVPNLALANSSITVTTAGPLGGAGTISLGGTLALTCSTCGVTTNPLSQFASTTSAQLLATISNPTGSGLLVFGTSPTLTTPNIGAATGSSLTLSGLAGGGTQCLQVSNTGVISGTGTLCGSGGGGVSSLTGDGTLFNNSASTGAVTLTFASAAASRLFGNPTASPASPTYFGVTSPLVFSGGALACTTCGVTSSGLNQFASTTSAQLAGVLSDETGTGVAVFSTSPSLTTPSLGAATATSINNVAITQPASSATLTIANLKTFTVSNTLTLTGTDGSSVAFGAGGTVAYTSNNLSVFASTTSAQLAGILSDEIGSGKAVFASALQGTDSNLLTAGTFTATAALPICTDANGGATTSGCPTPLSNPMSSANDMIIGGTGGTPTRFAGPTTYAGVPQMISSTSSGGVAGAETWAPGGVPFDVQSGATPSVVLTDRLSIFVTSNNTSSTNVTVPQSGATNFDANFAFVHCNTGSVNAIDTPTNSTINGHSTQTLLGKASGQNPECMFWWGDNTNYTGALILPTDTNGRLQATGFPALTSDVTNTAGSLATTVSAIQGTTVSGTTGTGNVVFSTSPILTTPSLGSATATGLTISSITGSTQCLQVNTSGVVSGTGTACGSGGGSPAWSSLTNPTAALSLTMPAGDTTTFTYATQASPTTTDFSFVGGADTGTSTVSIFSFIDTTANTRTGALLDVHSVGSSTALPIRITAQGTANGVQMSSAGLLSAIGSGGINASQVNSNTYPASTSFNSGGVFYASSTSAASTSLALTANSPVLGGGAGTAPKTVAGIASDGTSIWQLGVAGTSVGGEDLHNATSGTLSLRPPTGALGTVTNSYQAVTDTFVYRATSDTLTNKSISGSTNTLTNIGNGSLTNSSTTVNGQTCTLGSSCNVNSGASSGTYALNGSAGAVLTGGHLTDNGTINTSTESLDLVQNAQAFELANAGTTGTTVAHIAKATGAPSTAVITATTDTTGMLGIVIGGAGTTGNAQIAQDGIASCVFDGATTAGDYVQNSTGTAGDCHDAGASRPAGVQVIGRVLSTNGAGGTFAVLVNGPDDVSSAVGVTSFSGDGALLTNSGSTGSVTATLGTATAHKYWGNNTGSTTTPSYVSIVAGDLPTISTTVNGVTCTIGSTCTVNPPLDKSTNGLANPTADATFTYPNTSTTGLTISGTAPASVSTSTGTNASSIFNVSGVTGGATSNASGTAGIGSSPSVTAGVGGAGTGTNAVGGAGGSITQTAGAGGASAGTGVNSNGGSIVEVPGAAGTGGSGTAGKRGIFSVNDASGAAGFWGCAQGTANTTSNVNVPANSIILQCPTAVTAYTATLPGAAPTNNNSALLFSNTGTGSFAKMPQTAFVTTAYTNATTTFSSITNFAFSVEASTNYLLVCHMMYSGSVSTAGPKFQITGPASPTAVAITLDAGSTSLTGPTVGASAFSSAVTVGTVASTSNSPVALFMGLINGTTAGTIQVQAAANGTGTVTIAAGSYCQLQ